MKELSIEEFFKQISIDSGTMDIDFVRRVYYGMIRTMSRELRTKRRVKMPDWGDFILRMYKERNHRDVNTKQLYRLPPTPMLKFKVDYKLKKYFYALGEEKTEGTGV